ncbi:hypothetical protein MRX96_016642 [Rhipicephalus microplus]
MCGVAGKPQLLAARPTSPSTAARGYPSSRREDSVGWPDNLSALLDEIFSEAEESCTTPFPALLPASESAADALTAPSQQQDERGDAEIYVNVPLRVARPVEDVEEEDASKSPAPGRSGGAWRDR